MGNCCSEVSDVDRERYESQAMMNYRTLLRAVDGSLDTPPESATRIVTVVRDPEAVAALLSSLKGRRKAPTDAAPQPPPRLNTFPPTPAGQSTETPPPSNMVSPAGVFPDTTADCGCGEMSRYRENSWLTDEGESPQGGPNEPFELTCGSPQPASDISPMVTPSCHRPPPTPPIKANAPPNVSPSVDDRSPDLRRRVRFPPHTDSAVDAKYVPLTKCKRDKITRTLRSPGTTPAVSPASGMFHPSTFDSPAPTMVCRSPTDGSFGSDIGTTPYAGFSTPAFPPF
jgi:hypothetical protein